MAVATYFGAMADYRDRAAQLAGVKEIRAADRGGWLTFFTLVDMPLEATRAISDLELAIRDAHPDTPLMFRLYNLAHADPRSVAEHFPDDAEVIYRRAP